MSSPSSRAARIACAYFFFLNGLAVGSVVSRVPALVDQTGIAEAAIGSAILFVGVGGLAVFPLAGIARGSISSRAISALGAIFVLLSLPAVGLADDWFSLAIAFLLFGFANGILEIGGGTQAVLLESAAGKPMLSKFFAIFSLGGLSGAAIAAAAADISLVAHFLTAAIVLALPLPIALRFLLPDATNETAKGGASVGLRLPPADLAGIAGLALCAMIAEGSVEGWSALVMTSVHGATTGAASLAFGAFSATMIAGRLFGDHLRERFETVVLVRGLATLAAFGMAMAIFAPSSALALVGFALFGLGLSVLNPILFNAAGTHPAVDPSIGIASITTMGYLGLILGPTVIGAIAAASDLRLAIGLIIPLCMGIIVFAGQLRR